MSNKNNQPKLLHGIPVEDYLTDCIGPVAIAILEKCLYKYLQTDGVGMTGQELKMVQFAIERSYGTSTRKLEVTRLSDQEIVSAKLDEIDVDTLRKIADLNAPRDTVN